VFSADRVQHGIAVFDSRLIDSSVNILSWKGLSWVATKPANTNIHVYVRSSSSKDSVESQMWTGPFLNQSGEDISSQTGQFLQVRIVLLSDYDATTNTFYTPQVGSFLASSLISASSQAFFTKEISLGFLPKHLLLSYNGTISDQTLVRFLVAGKDTLDPAEYQEIDPNKIDLLDGIPSDSQGLKIMVSAVGSKEIPFVIDEFAIMLSGDGQKQINKDFMSP
jgi:hypothetical protein